MSLSRCALDRRRSLASRSRPSCRPTRRSRSRRAYLDERPAGGADVPGDRGGGAGAGPGRPLRRLAPRAGRHRPRTVRCGHRRPAAAPRCSRRRCSPRTTALRRRARADAARRPAGATRSPAARVGCPVALKVGRRSLAAPPRPGRGPARPGHAGAVARGVRGAGAALRLGVEVLGAADGRRPGVACVVEVVDDPAFGPVVGFGLGGDGGRTARRPGLAAGAADRRGRGRPGPGAARAAPLLTGYRGCAAGRPRRAGRPAAAGRPAGRRAARDPAAGSSIRCWPTPTA